MNWQVALDSELINLARPQHARAKVMVIYTGGTIGMVKNAKGAYTPFNFLKIKDRLPELDSLGVMLDMCSAYEPIDSSDATPELWKALAGLIEDKYFEYDGFVILHGTDTMAYTASALSFMLENLAKPVVLTGAQMPIGVPRNDARANLLSAIEIAADQQVSEVCIYFSGLLLRGNRSKKVESFELSAFASWNYLPLAKAGTRIAYNRGVFRAKPEGSLCVHYEFDTNVAILRVFPGITPQYMEGFLSINALRGIVIETYGAGNLPSWEWLLSIFAKIAQKGIYLLNVSQCLGGRVLYGDYANNMLLDELGIVSGGDMTVEAAITKLMHVLGRIQKPEEVKYLLSKNLAGEMN